jgi:glycosyltransferase involved in cell wall biosynthesis
MDKNKISNQKNIDALVEQNLGQCILLTIAIPTFNRIKCLQLLVESLRGELDRSRIDLTLVEILVCDNHSSDGTPQLLKSLSRPEVRVISHDRNYGADFNVRCCFENAKGRFVWIIGDDDLPMFGSLSPIIETLMNSNPDLMYLRNQWINSPLDDFISSEIADEKMEYHNSANFMKTVGIHLTFLSSMVVNKEKFLALPNGHTLDKYANTNLPHMAWTLPLMNYGNTFVSSKSIFLMARGANTGGYAVADVFGVMLTRILKEGFMGESKIFRMMYINIFAVFLPIWIWKARFTRNGEFITDIPWDEMAAENMDAREYKIFIRPLKFLPKWPALALVALGRLYGKLRI